MRKMPFRKHIKIWVPVVYCALLSLIKLYAPGSVGDAAFFAFLPLCFFIASANQYEQLKKIESLEAALKSRPYNN